MGDTTPRFTANGLRKEFGGITALDGIDLSVGGTTILGVAGPNGSGKTTLIRCLLGIISPSAGEVRVAGTRPTAFTAADRRRLGYMPQHTAVYDDLTVRENVAFFDTLYGVDDRAAAVDTALSVVGLTDRADSRIDELSGGMVRRTSLACALVYDPDMLFLDEPTVGLDPELRAAMWEGLRRRRDDGALVVVSTHYLGEVDRCDRVLFFSEGSVLALDSPERIREKTNTDDLEDAFLALVAADRGGVSGSGQDTVTASNRGGES